MNGDVFLFTRKARPAPGSRVLEVGSLDVNGSPRANFEHCEYIGIDFREGKGVDRVLDATQLLDVFPVEHFDVVLCCETLEHCEDWKAVLTNCWDVLKTGGKLVLTTPTKDKLRHNYPDDYWRWTAEQYAQMFAANPHIVHKLGRAGLGAIVTKQAALDLDVEPYRVP